MIPHTRMNAQRDVKSGSANDSSGAPLTIESSVKAPKRNLTAQVIRFGVVGVINTVVDLVVLNILIFATGTGRVGLTYALYKSIAFFCAVLNSYLMNRSWTFQRVPAKSQILEGSQFLFISALGWIVNVGSSWYVATFIRPVWGVGPELWPSAAALVGTAFSLGFNFLGYKFWVFAHRKH